ncbi:MAG: ABC transporter ATP-binding protein [Verrucomicrobiae bacterium]|nr:ABC transporter ATP-binding protein [Verrucomicrobiae bacterium]
MSGDKKPVLVLERITKSYRISATAPPLEVLDEIDLLINDGDSIAIVGPSGSGKSTFLNIVGTLDKPDSGKVLLDGECVDSMDEKELARVRNRKIGFVFQMHHLLPQCTALENVILPAIATKDGDYIKSAQLRAIELLERVGLGKRIYHKPYELSGGECQRVAVARALINNPRILIADEPTGSLDLASAESLAGLLLDLNEKDRITLLIATHWQDLASRMKRIYILRNGKLCSQK